MSSPVFSSLNVYIFVHFSPTLVQTKTPFNNANIYRKFRLLLFVTEFSSVYTWVYVFINVLGIFLVSQVKMYQKSNFCFLWNYAVGSNAGKFTP